ncbi:phage tail sheath subtilisin-like domain-containing protein [Chryseobacterium sp. Y16C]|uniref:phage tail sheath family protein n=1 Tax=Chryseobacterium sp. Y16C TaxID=2920939 RepID=UPI001F0C16BE|nr:phage tail sheath C-terminal domain-containing protein [Chryseobacterium sp. Y16C]UMQ43444.1 phage tail sheath subtilisin-like domain-containing protein [Chryseobacterium sp. Y16C]
MNYKTPGVYVEEIAKFPPSVAQVETAIPAFIGYTEKGQKNEPTRISSILEYETLFGKAKNEAFTFAVAAATTTPPIKPRTVTATLATPSPFKMYYAMQMYFANGGGPCYIVSVGDLATGYPTSVDKGDLEDGLDTLEKEDEPTLIVFPDAEGLSLDNAYDLYGLALDHAGLMKDRFVIMDVVGNTNTAVADFRDKLDSSENLKYGAAYYPKLETVLSYSYDPAIMVQGQTLEHWKTHDSELYNLAKNAIESNRVIMAPSSTMAGVYAKVDSTSGVFKAPANVGLNYVVAPTVKISHEDQESLNVDPTAGKSINAIRSFTGKGNLVWGARTLDGNSNEWRYISVRRFFNMVEESVKKATERFVFEPNTANTWIRVQTMIENFLNQQWQDGALAGSKPEEAYYVSVGLNKTMSAQDILEGRMNIEIGMAAVRPAEFIVLRFSHKLQEA